MTLYDKIYKPAMRYGVVYLRKFGGFYFQFSESCDKLAACKLTLDHVNQCIEAIQISLPILEQYSRIEQSIADGRYYHALKNLEDLEHSQLDLIRPFAFSEIIIHRIPKTRTRIKVCLASILILAFCFKTLVNSFYY